MTWSALFKNHATRMLNLPQLIRQFAKLPESAVCRVGPKGACLEVSKVFAKFLARHGLRTQLLRASWKYLGENRTAFNHVTVICEGLSVDWTARQFDAKAPIPMLVPAEEIEEVLSKLVDPYGKYKWPIFRYELGPEPSSR